MFELIISNGPPGGASWAWWRMLTTRKGGLIVLFPLCELRPVRSVCFDFLLMVRFFAVLWVNHRFRISNVMTDEKTRQKQSLLSYIYIYTHTHTH
jgi:hypothetical protein